MMLVSIFLLRLFYLIFFLVSLLILLHSCVKKSVAVKTTRQTIVLSVHLIDSLLTRKLKDLFIISQKIIVYGTTCIILFILRASSQRITRVLSLMFLRISAMEILGGFPDKKLCAWHQVKMLNLRKTRNLLNSEMKCSQALNRLTR